MNRKLLASAICASLFVAGTAYAQNATTTQTQDQTATAQNTKKEKPKTLETVTVTGSLIPQSEIETANPVITITSQEMEKQGFRNVYDALQTLTVSTGSVQGNQAASQGTFTPGAQVISLFGLDPAFTLTLLNGHPLADYPLPYNGGESITDLSNIPTAMVDHIDILTGGASSLYGSSAISGVINIVLKKHIEGTNLSFRVGGYQNGGGQNERLQFSGGHTWGKLSSTYALSVTNQNPLTVAQSFWPSRLENPMGPPYVAARAIMIFSPFTGAYDDPGAGACNAVSGLFGGTMGYDHRPNSGYYCGTYHDSDHVSLLNRSLNVNGYLNLTYQLNDNAELYGDVLYGFSKQGINGGPSVYSYYNPGLSQSANAYASIFFDPDVGDFRSVQRYIAPEEMGGSDGNLDRIRTRQYNADFGIRGNFGDSSWAYDAYYNRSQVNTSETSPWLLNGPATDYFLGQQQGTDPYGYGFPVFTPDYDHLYNPVSQSQWLAMSADIQSKSVSWQQNVHATITNTDLFEMAGGSAGFAAVAEWGNQSFHSPVDPRLIAGDFVGRTGTEGGGSRDRWAVGAELRLPLLKQLTADVSARYDSYSSAGRKDAKATYKLGLEYRPFDTLLLRANYATAFRAPDMYYLFQKPSGFYTGATDYYLCRYYGYTASNLGSCPYADESMFSFYRGSPDLKNVTATSWGYGLVWSPTTNFTLKADYTNIKISNEITTQSPDSLLQLEANCRLGVSFGGQAYDINSTQCQNAIAQVARFPANDPFVLARNQIQNVQTFPINIGSERANFIQASAQYKFDLGRAGDLALSADYFVELHHEYQQNPGDPYIDLLHNYNSYEFKTRTSASASWAVGKWTTTLFGTLYGKSVNYGGTGTMGRWATFNGSLNYQIDKDVAVQLTVNNLANRAPPTEYSFGSESVLPPPYYNFYVYNGYGRMTWLELQMHF
ncbi:MAG TPA: TonB-dependent receptor [Rhodanobacteraceae bacterium]|jgi:outer membrane receptor protein involved in Fe transport|nr:TonB-dependent receptor [Rhodanobacteraceae bacterium]